MNLEKKNVTQFVGGHRNVREKPYNWHTQQHQKTNMLSNSNCHAKKEEKQHKLSHMEKSVTKSVCQLGFKAVIADEYYCSYRTDKWKKREKPETIILIGEWFSGEGGKYKCNRKP